MTQSTPNPLLGATRAEIAVIVKGAGEPTFRAQQLLDHGPRRLQRGPEQQVDRRELHQRVRRPDLAGLLEHQRDQEVRIRAARVVW